MSFRWFIYFCALCGAWAALVGWGLGRVMSPSAPLLGVGIRGLLLGLFVALALGIVDALWNLPSGQYGQAGLRVGACVLVGSMGGLAGGIVGQLLYDVTKMQLFLVFGWVVTGLLIGLSVGVFEMLAALASGQPVGGPVRKLLKGVGGGAMGGLAGGLLSALLRGNVETVFHGRPLNDLWSPSAIGFVLVGMCIGLMIGLAQVLFREAWIRVQAGFRPGREMLLTKDAVVIGRAEGSDLPLFGDAGVAREHARIVRREGRFFLEDLGTPTGTFVNDARVMQPAALQSGDVIRVGRSILYFGERQKRAAAPAR